MRAVTQLVVKGTVEAAKTYIAAFELSMGLAVKHDDGTYAHLSLMYGDIEILSMTESGRSVNIKQPYDVISGIANIGVYGLTKDKVYNAYEVLKKDALIISEEPQSVPWLELYFILTDKFGVGWQVGT
jgi:uncharacterized glyoxalase superfamily protein PhnB